MTDGPNPVFRVTREIVLVGTMAIYNSQDEASQGIPQQWRSFLAGRPALARNASFYGASPCTPDRKIHYLTGVADGGPDCLEGCEPVTLEAGEYAVVVVEDAELLRDTWTWLLGTWLSNSGRRERNAPEFERYAGISEAGTPTGPVEIWIPLEPLPND